MLNTLYNIIYDGGFLILNIKGLLDLSTFVLKCGRIYKGVFVWCQK